MIANRKTGLFAPLLCGLLFALSSLSAKADTISSTGTSTEDPPLFVTGGCGTGLYGGETNGICNGTSFDVTNHNGGISGSKDLSTPLLIILGIPGTGSGDSAPTLVYGGNNYTPGGTAVWGWNGSASEVLFDASSGSNDVYEQLGLSKGSGGADSESFVNWQGWDSYVNGLTVNAFGIFVYELPVGLNAGETISMGFTGGTAFGSYAVAAGCVSIASTSPCTPSGNVGSTPFTNAGLDNRRVPEPGTIALFSFGLIGLGFLGFLARRFLSVSLQT